MSTTDFLQQLLVAIVVMILSFFMQELPGSNVLQSALPEWPFLFALYFAVSSHYFFGILLAFCVGVIEDVFLGVPVLGLHAAIYVLAVFVMIASRLRFKHMSVTGQGFFVGLLVLAKVLVVMIFEGVWYSPPAHYWIALSIPMSMLAWPLINMFFGFFSVKHTA